MSKYENFWIVTFLRGVLAILISSAIFVVPDMARTLLFLPFAVAFVILSLIVYGIVDSVLVFITSFFLSLRVARFALRLQSAVCLGMGILFCSILFNWIRLEWFLYLIALQAFTTAYAEVTIARHTSAKLTSFYSYGAASVALLCAMIYAIASFVVPAGLSPRQIAYLAYAYLATFGAAQLLTAARMLYLGRQASRVAAA